MLTFWTALKYAGKLWFSVFTTSQTILSGVFESVSGVPFYSCIFQENWRWIVYFSILSIVFIGAVFYSILWKQNTKLKELQNNSDNWNYYFRTNNTLLQEKVYVEIRKRNESGYGSELFAIARTDRIDDSEKRTMVFNHIGLYDKDSKKILKKNPSTEIKDGAEMYFYRPNISDEGYKAILLGGEV